MLAYLQLLRLPTVFTAMADIVLGFVLTHGLIYGPLRGLGDGLLDQPIGWNEPGNFAALLTASCCLYLSGMVFNDVFDRKQDALERPGRPIPSGQVSLKSAAILGTVLMVIGVTSAALVGSLSVQVALLLVVTILGYDGILKQTPLGPLAMGTCRFLNVLLGASVQSEGFPSLLSGPQLAAATGLGVYIVGVTLFARTEARTSNRWQLGLAQSIMNFGIITLVWLIMSMPIQSPISVSLAMLMVVAFTINRRAFAAVRNPSPATVQGGVKIMLLSLVMMDATLIYWYLNTPDTAAYGARHALATAALIIPAMYIGRRIPMT